MLGSIPLLTTALVAVVAAASAPSASGEEGRRGGINVLLETGAGWEHDETGDGVQDGLRIPALLDATAQILSTDSVRARARSSTEAEWGPSRKSFRQSLYADARVEAAEGLRVTLELSGFYAAIEESASETVGAKGFLFAEVLIDSLSSSIDAGFMATADQDLGEGSSAGTGILRAGWTQIALARPLLLFRVQVLAEFAGFGGGAGRTWSPTAIFFMHIEDPHGAAFTLLAQYRRDDFETEAAHAFSFGFRAEIRMWENLSLIADYSFQYLTFGESSSFERRHCITLGLKLEGP